MKLLIEYNSTKEAETVETDSFDLLVNLKMLKFSGSGVEPEFREDVCSVETVADEGQ